MIWHERISEFADSVASACATACAPDPVRVDDKSRTMYAAEDVDEFVAPGQFANGPYVPIGSFHEHHVRRITAHRLFGLRWPVIAVPHTVVMVGIEEMFDFPGHTRGVWCAVRDERLVPIVRPIAEAFAARYRLRLDFAPKVRTAP